MIDLLLDVGLMTLALFAIHGIGSAAQRVLRVEMWCFAAEIALTLALGLGVTVTLLFLFALTGLLVPMVGWGIVIVGVILGTINHQQILTGVRLVMQSARRFVEVSWFIQGAIILTVAFTLMNFEADLAPPVEGDTVHQYLLTARYWVDAGRYIQPSHIWASTLPGNMMLLSAWALLLRDSYSLATLVTGFGMSLFLALAVYALARLLTGPRASVLAVAAVYTMPDAGYLAQSAKVDMGWAFFEALALAGFLRWMKGEDRKEVDTARWLVVSGIMLGLAAGSKNQTVISIALLGGWLVIRKVSAGDIRGLTKSAMTFGLAVLLAALPFYLYNGIVHRNPIYPVFADQFVQWFGATASPRSELGTEIFYPWTIGGYLTNVWNASTGHPPGFYLGFIVGPVFLIAIPVGAMTGIFRRQARLRKLLIYTFVFSSIWFLVKQAARHLLPGLTLLGVVSGVVLVQIDNWNEWQGKIIRIVVLACMGWNLASELGVLYWSGAYRTGLGLESRDEYLERWHNEVIGPTFPDWETIILLNEQVGQGERILTNHATSSLYIAPDVVSGNWGDRLRYDTVQNADKLVALLVDHGIAYLLIYKEGQDQNSLYDNPDFLSQHGELVAETGRAKLYRLVK